MPSTHLRKIKPSEQRALAKKRGASPAVPADTGRPRGRQGGPGRGVGAASTRSVKRDPQAGTREGTATTPDYQPVDVRDFPEILDVLPPLINKYHQVSQAIKHLEGQKAEIRDQIIPFMDAVDQHRVVSGGLLVTRVRGRNSTISKTGLLEQGVKIEAIEAATVTKEYDYVKISERGDTGPSQRRGQPGT